MLHELRDAPYANLMPDLIRSILAAQGELLRAYAGGEDPINIPDERINRHFVWMALVYREGVNRHLFDGYSEIHPLRTIKLRALRRIPSRLREVLEARRSLDLPETSEGLSDDIRDYVQREPTRISRLVKLSYVPPDVRGRGASDDGIGGDSSRTHYYLRSSLAIAWAFLTAPELPGTRAYALLALRNYLFSAYQIVPDNLVEMDPQRTFSTRDLEQAHARIWTSLRPRHWSGGQDKLPAEGTVPVDGLLRHFLSARDLLWLRFSDLATTLAYCDAGDLLPRTSNRFEFTRSEYLERLPEFGEIVNEIWGLPIPIRGADTIFRGGLKLSSRKGLVVSIHGGPGTGKTTLALALGAYLAPFEIQTLFITAEESSEDLMTRAESLVSDEVRRLSFEPSDVSSWLTVQRYSVERAPDDRDLIDALEDALEDLRKQLLATPPAPSDAFLIPKPCRAIVVLDGLQDVFLSASDGPPSRRLPRLRELVESFRELRALVVLTTGEEWAKDVNLDYLVDLAIRLSQDSLEEYGKKPDRRIMVSKARHQLCATGTHGYQLSGSKGVRFSPQINYQLDRRSIWTTRLPDMTMTKDVLGRVCSQDDIGRIPSGTGPLPDVTFEEARASVMLPRGTNIFINGRGSTGKAALALKIAISPIFTTKPKKELVRAQERVLIISFLYPQEYYDNILKRLLRIRFREYGLQPNDLRPIQKVIHLYPGYLRPNDLFNRVEWEIEAAELRGEPYTSVVVDGIHNVFLQFPEIERYGLFWPQLYSALRSRPLTIITTHTMLAVPQMSGEDEYRLDDRRSEPLRHALVQKTDFQIEVGPVPMTSETGMSEPNAFPVRTVSAINQPIPKDVVYWSREKLALFGDWSEGAREAKRRRETSELPLLSR